jgi:signal transduction histidine kinase
MRGEALNGLSDDVRSRAYPSSLGTRAPRPGRSLKDLLRRVFGPGRAQRLFSAAETARDFPKGVALCLYRVVQEALHNVAKHSGAGRASVTLIGAGRGLMLTVEDQGRGFDPAAAGKRGLGLVRMKERIAAAGGVLTISARARRGLASPGSNPVEMRIRMSRPRLLN